MTSENGVRVQLLHTRARFLVTRDGVGNPTRVDRTGSVTQTQTYGYDVNDRITSVCFQASCPGATDPKITWTYDAVGNRLSQQRTSGTTTYTYNAGDQLLTAGSTSYSYDANGNELSAGTRTFTYDLGNRLKTTTAGTTTTTYTYNGDGVRLQASTGSAASAKTNFLWDVSHELPQLALERDGSNALQRRYTYGIRRLRQANGTASYYAYDALGSVAGLLSNAGAAQRSWTYEPYGSIYTSSGTSPTNFVQFTGEYLDPTGLYHLRARQYDPVTGRFLRVDPADQTVHDAVLSAYAYVANRPTVMVDPSGETFRLANGGQRTAFFAGSTVEPLSPSIDPSVSRQPTSTGASSAPSGATSSDVAAAGISLCGKRTTARTRVAFLRRNFAGRGTSLCTLYCGNANYGLKHIEARGHFGGVVTPIAIQLIGLTLRAPKTTISVSQSNPKNLVYKANLQYGNPPVLKVDMTVVVDPYYESIATAYTKPNIVLPPGPING